MVFGQRSQLWWDLPLRDSFDAAAPHLPGAGRRARRPAAPLPRPARPGRLPGHPGAAALARPADARRADRRPAARPAGALPRRADDRAGRGEQAGGPRASWPSWAGPATPRWCSPPTTWPTSSGSAARLVVIDHGRVVHDGSIDALHARYGSRRLVVAELDAPLPTPPQPAGAPLHRVEADGRRLVYALESAGVGGGGGGAGRGGRAARRLDRRAGHRGRGGPALPDPRPRPAPPVLTGCSPRPPGAGITGVRRRPRHRAGPSGGRRSDRFADLDPGGRGAHPAEGDRPHDRVEVERAHPLTAVRGGASRTSFLILREISTESITTPSASAPQSTLESSRTPAASRRSTRSARSARRRRTRCRSYAGSRPRCGPAAAPGPGRGGRPRGGTRRRPRRAALRRCSRASSLVSGRVGPAGRRPATGRFGVSTPSSFLLGV